MSALKNARTAVIVVVESDGVQTNSSPFDVDNSKNVRATQDVLRHGVCSSSSGLGCSNGSLCVHAVPGHQSGSLGCVPSLAVQDLLHQLFGYSCNCGEQEIGEDVDFAELQLRDRLATMNRAVIAPEKHPCHDVAQNLGISQHKCHEADDMLRVIVGIHESQDCTCNMAWMFPGVDSSDVVSELVEQVRESEGSMILTIVGAPFLQSLQSTARVAVLPVQTAKPGKRKFFPMQSHSVKESSKCKGSCLVGAFCSISLQGRSDGLVPFDMMQAWRTGCSNAIQCAHMVHELAFHIGGLPKYGA